MTVLCADGDDASATRTARSISVNGGHTSTSARVGRAFIDALSATMSANCAVNPFIFQFPTISGRIVSAVVGCRLSFSAWLSSQGFGLIASPAIQLQGTSFRWDGLCAGEHGVVDCGRCDSGVCSTCREHSNRRLGLCAPGVRQRTDAKCRQHGQCRSEPVVAPPSSGNRIRAATPAHFADETESAS